MQTKSWFMPEMGGSIYGDDGGDDDDASSEDDDEDDDDGMGIGMLSAKFRLAGPGSSSVRRLGCRLKKSFSTPSFRSFLDNNVAAASLLLSPPPAKYPHPRLPTYPETFEAVQDDDEDGDDDDEDDDNDYR